MDKKQLILDTATKMFYKQGYKKTKMEDIASKANVSKVTIFKYFESKKKLAHVVVIKAIRDGYYDFGLIVNDTSIGFKEKVQRMIEAKYESAAQMDPDFQNFMLEDMQEKGETLNEYNRGKEKFWNNFFNEGRKSGELRPEISNNTILIYIDMLMNYVTSHDVKGTDTLGMIDIFFHGVMKDDKN